ncbi:MAG: arsenate reductase ArsC [Tenuifilaceae bacterium]|nr:arsenate reductase ArsC [Bacteroidales bacterium]MDI9515413.1 arsenate reductase ArsC [Bacteroidota bacterium]NLH55991.1 arsenate reductase ArsC [Rikenellaceae bacterium]OQC63072.1 MAG: Protein ArsC [Bacteroidetes bacterium ADurb.Bin008]HNV82371.1 arsenate reductase ArsC [Tenuifilaceae bacterium]
MKKILLISERNSCRSQMAEGWLRYYGKGSLEVHSAGIIPTTLDPHAAYAMSQEIIDISGYKSKGIGQFLDQEFDYILVLCDNIGDKLAAFKGKPQIYEFPFPDVASMNLSGEEKSKAYAQLRDELENFCFDFVHQKIKALI